MPRIGNGSKIGLTIGSILLLWGGLATPALAKAANLKDSGFSLWVFILVASVIVLLQLIPAIILFFSFLAKSSNTTFGRKKTPGKTAG